MAKNNGEAVMTGGTVKTTMDKPVVVIDPGHGGMDGGCVSVDGTPEKGDKPCGGGKASVTV